MWRRILCFAVVFPGIAIVDRWIAPRFFPEFFSTPVATLIVLVLVLIVTVAALMSVAVARDGVRRLRQERHR